MQQSPGDDRALAQRYACEETLCCESICELEVHDAGQTVCAAGHGCFALSCETVCRLRCETEPEDVERVAPFARRSAARLSRAETDNRVSPADVRPAVSRRLRPPAWAHVPEGGAGLRALRRQLWPRQPQGRRPRAVLTSNALPVVTRLRCAALCAFLVRGTDLSACILWSTCYVDASVGLGRRGA